MAKKSSSLNKMVVPGRIDEYIKTCPQEVRAKLEDIRAAIQSASTGNSETVIYFFSN